MTLERAITLTKNMGQLFCHKESIYEISRPSMHGSKIIVGIKMCDGMKKGRKSKMPQQLLQKS